MKTNEDLQSRLTRGDTLEFDYQHLLRIKPMNQQDYIKAAQELSKIPGMERSPWRLCETKNGALFIRMVDNWQSHLTAVGCWLNIDDFSDWSAAKIAHEVWDALGFPDNHTADERASVGQYAFSRNLEVVRFIIEANKINPAAVDSALPKE